jgi:hypothetical protein
MVGGNVVADVAIVVVVDRTVVVVVDAGGTGVGMQWTI